MYVCEHGLELEPDNTDHLSLVASVYILLQRIDDGKRLLSRVQELKGPQEGDITNLALGFLRGVQWDSKLPPPPVYDFMQQGTRTRILIHC